MLDARLIVVVFVGLMIGGVVLASGSLQPAGFTDGEIGAAHKWRGRVTNTDTDYVTSWLPNTQSEDITAVAEGMLVGTTGHDWTSYRMVAYLEGVEIARNPSSGWIEIPDQFVEKNVWFQVGVWTFNVDGPLVGKLKIEMEVKLIKPWWDPFAKSYEGPFGWDGSHLKSGNGELFLYGDKGPFEEGETAQMYVKTGFTNGVGWSLKLRPPLTRPGLFPVRTLDTLPDDWNGIIPITIEQGWFVEGELEDNMFIVELWNQFFNDKFEHIFTIDQRARAPGEPAFSFTLEQNQATITAVSEATFKNIEKFVVWAWYGTQSKPSVSDSQDWILFAKEYSPTSTGDNYSVTFTVNGKNFDGAIVVEVIAADTDGRASPPGTLSFKVRNGELEPGPKITQPFIWAPMVFLLIAIGLIFGFIVAYYVWITTGSMGMTIFAFLIVFGAFGVGAYIAGTVPSIATLLGLSVGGI